MSLLDARQGSTDEALALFDALDPVDLAFMKGRWKGSEIRTGHPMDGWLEASGWFGKEFVDLETVHPLLFQVGDALVRVAPHPLAMRWLRRFPFLQAPLWRPLLRLAIGLQRTEASQARLRMVETRGKLSAAMLYDALPVVDSFRRIDADSVLGIMDEKGVPQPFVFLLQRC